MDWKKLGDGLMSGFSSGLAGLGVSSIGQMLQLPFTNAGKGFDREMQERAFQHQVNMLRMQNEWNKPSHQAKLMQEGGFSPSALFEHGSTISQATAPSVPSAVSQFHMPQMIQNPFGAFSSISQALESLSGVDKNVAQLDEVRANVKRLLSDANLSDANSRMNNILANFENTFGERLRSTTIQKNIADFLNSLSSAHLNNAKGDTEKTIQSLNKAKEEFTKATKGLTDLEKQKLQIQVDHEEEVILADIDEMRSTAASNYANAQQTRLFNKLYNDRRFQYSFISKCVDEARSIGKQNNISDKQLELMEYQIEQAGYANDMKEFTYWTNQLNKTIETVGSAASQFYGAGALRELIHLRKGMQGSKLDSGKDFFLDKDGILRKKGM